MKTGRGRYIRWTEGKLAAVAPHLSTLEEGPRLEGARQALLDAGFAEDAEVLTKHKLKTAFDKLAEPQRNAIAINHKQKQKKKAREKTRQSEGLALRAQDVANIARIQQRLYPGVGMNGVLPGGLPLGQRDVSDDMAEEDRGITFTVENDENSDGTPLLLPPVVIEAQKGVRGARSVVQIVGAQSHITDLLTLQIDANDAHCLVLTYQFKPEALNLEFEEEQRYNAKLESYHVSLQAMEASTMR